MTKTLTYSGLVIGSLLVILGFLTAKTYSQLAVAVVLYPALIFLALRTFPRKSFRSPKITTLAPLKSNQDRSKSSKPKTESTLVADIDKRTFIKLIGATGISFFLFSLLGRWVEALFFGRAGLPLMNTSTGATGNDNQFGLAGDSQTAGYKISEVDEGPVSYYGFINKDGAWLIMREESNGGSFRYARGNLDFPQNWSNRENLNYEYFHNLF